MPIYHLEAKIIGRTAGQSSIASAAYRSGEAIEDVRTREIHRHGRAERVAHVEIIAPADAPAWATSRADLWNQVETREKRKDAQLAREFELALPRELSLDQQRELLRSWIAAEITPAGAVADLAIHVDKQNNNPHAHIMTTMRAVSADGWGSQKLRQWEDRSALARWRESWAEHTNRALERAGVEARVDHRSHADRGLEEEPTIKEGYRARLRVERGQDSERVALNRVIRARNRRLRERAAKALAAARALPQRASAAMETMRGKLQRKPADRGRFDQVERARAAAQARAEDLPRAPEPPAQAVPSALLLQADELQASRRGRPRVTAKGPADRQEPPPGQKADDGVDLATQQAWLNSQGRDR